MHYSINCAVNVHKSCRTLLTECNRSKNKATNRLAQLTNRAPWFTSTMLPFDWSAKLSPVFAYGCKGGEEGRNMGEGRGLAPDCSVTGASSALTTSFSSSHLSPAPRERERDQSSSAPDCPSGSTHIPGMTLTPQGPSAQPASNSSSSSHNSRSGAPPGDMDELDSLRLGIKRFNEDAVSLAPSTTDSIIVEELIQTEMHHVRILKIMLRVYVRELKEHLHLDDLFPRLETLLQLHTHFLFSSFLSLLQFSGDIGEQMKESYGDFCSHHTEAVGNYKEQLHSNKKFQNLIRKVNNLSVVRRLGVTECILLVTQRITKYPVLVERIVQNTEVGTEEHDELSRSLGLIKDCIVQVDALVNLHEKASRLRDIAHKMEPKSLGKIKDGRVFHREDLAQDILAVLLSDVLLLLQEKDQRYVFSAVDNKPSVISLQKLIVREVAHEEKAMFLICTSSKEPEICPHTEERLFSEEEEEARAARFKEFQVRLSQKDGQIVADLTEKLQLFSDMGESGPGDTACRSHLLLRGDASDLHQGETLLKGAITDVESLQNLLLSGVIEPAPRPAEGSGDGNQKGRSDPQLKKIQASQTLEQAQEEEEASPAIWNTIWSNTFPEAEFFDRVLMLSQRLYSLQAIIAQQDSYIELQRASLNERASFPGRHRGNVLLEQEKQRTLVLQREEMASFHKLQSQHRQEQARWEKERQRHRLQAEDMEARLRQREEECRRLEEKLAEDREELERQRETYQQDLERLRESTRTVDKEKERLEQQRKIKRKTIEKECHSSHSTRSGQDSVLLLGQEKASVFGILTFIQTGRKLEVGETVGRVDAGIETFCTSWSDSVI
ncbi:unnamed protein product [Coregonus sp. 'balchen']|nr:unnamed protein product [Coregonus sp. 'balchen']